VGGLPRVELGGLKGPFKVPWMARALSHKRWAYAMIATPEVMLVLNVADLGYSALGYAVAVDLLERRVLSDDGFLGPPGPLGRVGDAPGRGLDAYFRTLGASLSLRRPQAAERLVLDVKILGLRAQHRAALRVRAEVLGEGGPPPLVAIAPVEQGWVNVTQKQAGLLSFGTLLAGGRTYGLDGGVAGLDYTQGLLARRTAWRWAMALGRLADGAPIGINLVEGFNEGKGANENAAWVGNQLFPLGRARFEYRKDDPLEPWRVRTDDGKVDLEMRPFHVHREQRNLGFARSRFLEPLGHFSGTLRLDGRTILLERIAGVTEDQDVLW
jgi:hypothetical protein